MTAPIARILLRYGVGVVLGMELGQRLATDTDVVAIVALAVGAVVEGAYALAKRRGWAT